MIESYTISEINTDSKEGQILIATLAILTSINCADISAHKFGGMSTPDSVLKLSVILANKIFYEGEYESYITRIERENKIDSILL